MRLNGVPARATLSDALNQRDWRIYHALAMRLIVRARNLYTMTKSVLHIKVVASLLLAFAGNVSAATFTNVSGGANTGLPFASFGNAANPSGDSPKVGQVFSLLTDSTLSSFSFYALGNTTSTASLQLNVAQWNPDTNAKNQAVNLVG
ncbi:MAG: hypothetical protein Q8M27_00770 [Methylotenera sp.]|nr:hypothetical protein [Methylotenera sp.]